MIVLLKASLMDLWDINSMEEVVPEENQSLLWVLGHMVDSVEHDRGN